MITVNDYKKFYTSVIRLGNIESLAHNPGYYNQTKEKIRPAQYQFYVEHAGPSPCDTFESYDVGTVPVGWVRDGRFNSELSVVTEFNSNKVYRFADTETSFGRHGYTWDGSKIFEDSDFKVRFIPLKRGSSGYFRAGSRVSQTSDTAMTGYVAELVWWGTHWRFAISYLLSANFGEELVFFDTALEDVNDVINKEVTIHFITNGNSLSAELIVDGNIITTLDTTHSALTGAHPNTVGFYGNDNDVYILEVCLLEIE